MRSSLRKAALSVFRGAAATRTALRIAAARGRALILVYHRVVPDSDPALAAIEPIVPRLGVIALTRQLQRLSEIGDFVSLDALLDSCSEHGAVPTDRIRICVTFDDDEPSHLHQAMPLLRSLGVPATFFLCGRALHGLGAPWWIRLEQEIERSGLERTATLLDVTASTPAQLAAVAEGTPLVARIERDLPPPLLASVLSGDDIAALAAAPAVSIGFHTVLHPVLTQLDESQIDHALTFGRDRLAEAARAPVNWFAYPHGKWNASVAHRTRLAGYRCACRSSQRPVSPGGDSFALGRWDPGALADDELIAQAAFRLNL